MRTSFEQLDAIIFEQLTSSLNLFQVPHVNSLDILVKDLNH